MQAPQQNYPSIAQPVEEEIIPDSEEEHEALQILNRTPSPEPSVPTSSAVGRDTPFDFGNSDSDNDLDDFSDLLDDDSYFHDTHSEMYKQPMHPYDVVVAQETWDKNIAKERRQITAKNVPEAVRRAQWNTEVSMLLSYLPIFTPHFLAFVPTPQVRNWRVRPSWKRDPRKDSIEVPIEVRIFEPISNYPSLINF